MALGLKFSTCVGTPLFPPIVCETIKASAFEFVHLSVSKFLLVDPFLGIFSQRRNAIEIVSKRAPEIVKVISL